MPIKTETPATGSDQPISPEKYMNCKCCSSILGYWAKVESVPYFFTFSYPPIGICKDMSTKRINARILDGDVFCSRCGNWQEVVFNFKVVSNFNPR